MTTSPQRFTPAFIAEEKRIDQALQSQILGSFFAIIAAIGGIATLLGPILVITEGQNLRVAAVILVSASIITLFFGTLSYFSNRLHPRLLFILGATTLIIFIAADFTQTGTTGQFLLLLSGLIILTVATQGRIETFVVLITSLLMIVLSSLIVQRGLVTPLPASATAWPVLGFRYTSISLIIFFLAASTLRYLTENLSKSLEIQKEIEDQNRNLEGIVEQRTLQLSQALEVSQNMSRQLDRDLLNREIIYKIRQIFSADSVVLFDLDKQRPLSGGDVVASTVKNRAITSLNQGLTIGVPIVDNSGTNPIITHVLVVKRARDAFNDQEKQLLLNLGRQYFSSIQNIELYQQLQRRLTNQIIFNRLREKIEQAHNVKMLLQVTSQELGDTLDAKKVQIDLDRSKWLLNQVNDNGRSHA